jgi:uracil-DNA glycosylase
MSNADNNVGAPASTPKLLGDPERRSERHKALASAEHMKGLTDLVTALNRGRAEIHVRGNLYKAVPNFDPWDGGIDAEILFLLEAPGPRALQTGFVSRDNPDETAKNFLMLNEEAKLPRVRTITWNIVPWFLGAHGRIRAANTIDIAAGITSLEDLVELLRKLRVVVLVGRKAQKARSQIIEIAKDKRVLELLECPHPSPQNINRRKVDKHKILQTLNEARGHIERPR